MQELLAWYNLIFYIPILGGILMVLGSALGLGGGDTSHDVEQDISDHEVTDGESADGDAEGDHASDATKVFSLLGIGRVPITIILMLAWLSFGGTGVILNTILAPIFRTPMIYTWISIGGALVSMVAVTGLGARAIARLLPTTETYLVKRRDLVGRTGKLVLDATTSSGMVQVYDKERNLHQVTCRTRAGLIPAGSEVIVVDYHPDDNTYIVEESPLVPQWRTA